MLARIAILWGVIAASAPAAITPTDPLTLGVFPRRNFTETITMFSPLARYLSGELGREVRLETARDFPAFWDGVASKRFDIVHYNQYHYVKSHKEFGYDAVAKNEEFGKSTIAGAIVVRKDAGIKRLRDLRGKKIVFGGGRDAMQAYLVNTDLLRQAGLKPGDYIEDFAINPPNAAMAVYFRQADAAGAGDIVLQLPIVRSKIDTSELIYLTVGKPLSHLPWAVRGELDTAIKSRIKRALLKLNKTADGKKILADASLTGLVAATDADYHPHRRIIYTVTGERY